MKLLSLLCCLLVIVDSFDIGYHQDVIESALTFYGFSQDSKDLIKIASWWIDYFSYYPEKEQYTIPGFQKLHVDSLFTGLQIEQYFSKFIENVRTTLPAFVKNETGYHILLGLTLHVIADTHSHAKWGQETGLYRSSCDCFTDNSYWSADCVSNTNMMTGTCSLCTISELIGRNDSSIKHGGYCDGINRDSTARLGFEEAYVGAFLSSLQWILSFDSWVKELCTSGIVSSSHAWVATPTERALLNTELKYMEGLSMYIKIPLTKTSGHWKGPGSGTLDDFSVMLGMSILESNFWRDLTRSLSDSLVNGIYTTWSTRNNAIWPSNRSSIDIGWKVVVLRASGFSMDDPQIFGGDDPYLIVTINGQQFKEAIQMDSSEGTPQWKSMYFVQSSISTVPITVELWNFNGETSSDDQYDINPSSTSLGLALTYNVNSHEITGDVSGIHDTDASAVQTTGDGNGGTDIATLTFSVKTKTIGSCTGSSLVTCVDAITPEICSIASTPIISLVLLLLVDFIIFNF